MDRKHSIYLFMFIGSAAGSYMPLIWGDSAFSITSIILTAVGGFLGIWVGYKLGN